MKYKSLGLIVLLAAFAGSALAQNHISSTIKCTGKSDSDYTVQVGDYPGHILVISKGGSCTNNPPIEIAGLKATQGHSSDGVSVADVTGAKFQDRGYIVTLMENGDKIYGANQDTGIVTEGGKTTFEGTWSYTDGTGKFKGIKAKGTYKGSGDLTSGDLVLQVEGEYTLPGAGNQSK